METTVKTGSGKCSYKRTLLISPTAKIYVPEGFFGVLPTTWNWT